MSRCVMDGRERVMDFGDLRSAVISATAACCCLVSTWTMAGETFSMMLGSKALSLKRLALWVGAGGSGMKKRPLGVNVNSKKSRLVNQAAWGQGFEGTFVQWHENIMHEPCDCTGNRIQAAAVAFFRSLTA
jgi:hypothetical protein